MNGGRRLPALEKRSSCMPEDEFAYTAAFETD